MIRVESQFLSVPKSILANQATEVSKESMDIGGRVKLETGGQNTIGGYGWHGA